MSESELIEIVAEDGIRIVAEAFGPEQGIPVLFIGGVGQTRHSWRRAAEQFAAAGYRAVLLDLRGHGDSGWSPDHIYSFARFAADAAAIVRKLGRPTAFVGASLGGKVGLAVAGYYGPDIASAVVMVDTVPRNNWVSGAAQVPAPEEGFASLDEASQALAGHRGDTVAPGSGERLRKSMRMNENGRWHWHWDPPMMDESNGLGVMDSLDYLNGAAARTKVPVLVARAEFSQDVDDTNLAEFRALTPQLEVETTPGARHMLVGDQNDVFAGAAIAFLDRHLRGQARA